MVETPEPGSTRPYLIRAMYEWCTDNGFTPHIAVAVSDSVQVPREYVKDGEIVLNISLEATSGLQLGNDWIEFKARFGGTPRDIMVPVQQVLAVFARENGEGMAFPRVAAATQAAVAPAAKRDTAASPEVRLVPSTGSASLDADPPEPPRPASPGARPALKRIK
ncbi:MAG: ClpXP protease specificity-enhancing factor [Rhodoferax sp.]|nr:ClpXP protease specificity-enhancing factor [Rhodoferax sp.]